jgi:hypothetical protein
VKPCLTLELAGLVFGQFRIFFIRGLGTSEAQLSIEAIFVLDEGAELSELALSPRHIVTAAIVELEGLGEDGLGLLLAESFVVFLALAGGAEPLDLPGAPPR